jgi:hypothetical protein
MSRLLLLSAAVLAVATPARADRIAPIASPAERALRSPVVFVGKVTAIEKEPTLAVPHPGGKDKVQYKVAVVKVETNLAGAEEVTHFHIGVLIGGRYPDLQLTVGQEALFFLAKHHSGEFHVMPYMTPPIDGKLLDFKAHVESAKAILAVVADPAKSLKAEKAADRHAAAVALVIKYRTAPEGTREVETVSVPADESRRILKALAEGDWKPDLRGGRLNALTAFYQLGLGEADGWKTPGEKPGVNPEDHLRTEFAKWIDGPGKDYKIKKIVPKK